MHPKMIHFLIIFCLIFLSKSDNCGTTYCRRSGNECVDSTSGKCSTNCKPNLLSDSDTNCYDCNSGSSISNNYYFIDGLTCTSSSSCGGKIIQRNQCVSSCGNLYDAIQVILVKILIFIIIQILVFVPTLIAHLHKKRKI